VLAFQGLSSERYAVWVPVRLASATLLAALALAAVAAVAGVLLARRAVGLALRGPAPAPAERSEVLAEAR